MACELLLHQKHTIQTGFSVLTIGYFSWFFQYTFIWLHLNHPSQYREKITQSITPNRSHTKSEYLISSGQAVPHHYVWYVKFDAYLTSDKCGSNYHFFVVSFGHHMKLSVSRLPVTWAHYQVYSSPISLCLSFISLWLSFSSLDLEYKFHRSLRGEHYS